MRVGALLALTLLWIGLFGEVSVANVSLGLTVSALALAVSGQLVSKERRNVRLPAVLRLVAVFGYELVKTNLMVAGYVLSPRLRFQPGILELRLRVQGDGPIVLFGTLMTLTPGVVVLGVSKDRSRMYLNSIDVSDPAGVLRSTERLERCVLELQA